MEKKLEYVKDHAIRIVISDKQYKALYLAAEARGVRPNEMARTLLLSILMPYRTPVVDEEGKQ